ncbi:potassium channel family protein [Tichowtungia aerotolerans]|uniref:Potassium channel protein n=1 Tax=Tichowtungia aerotolerans TaxID=2697043 RepID=A0A6P1MC04_9BACT|nr:potassium channel protein [Tichowtungia aerotolerans]QHI69618.1 potassium channel protein [Tichowtungia aerotolerans]
MKFDVPFGRSGTGLRSGLIGIVSVLFSGMIGYHVIEGWRWLDGLYMTVITVSTVGIMEVHPLSDAGRIFTCLLILFGVGVMAYCLTRLAEFMLHRSLTNVLGRRAMKKKIETMKNHAIICGYGRTGSRVVAELQAAGLDFVIIDNSEEVIARLEERGIACVHGDATKEESLAAANIDSADSLVATLETDPDNLYLTLTASGLRPGLRIIARVNDPESTDKFRKAGARRVVSPVASGANQIAQLITRPAMVDLVELVTRKKSIALKVVEHPLEETSEMIGKTLAEARVRQTLGCMVIAIKHLDGDTAFDPGPNTRLQLGDILVGIHQPENSA